VITLYIDTIILYILLILSAAVYGFILCCIWLYIGLIWLYIGLYMAVYWAVYGCILGCIWLYIVLFMAVYWAYMTVYWAVYSSILRCNIAVYGCILSCIWPYIGLHMAPSEVKIDDRKIRYFSLTFCDYSVYRHHHFVNSVNSFCSLPNIVLLSAVATFYTPCLLCPVSDYDSSVVFTFTRSYRRSR
jgi:hypothetical protein